MADPGGAGSRGHLRAAHADREHVIEVLKVAFVQGRLTKDELDARVGQAFASRTYAELAAVTADIPAEAVAPRPGPAARPQRPGNATLKRGALVITAATIVAAGVWVAALSTDVAILGLMAWKFTVTWLGIVLIAGAVMLDSPSHERSGGRLPPRRTPDAGGPAPRRPAQVGRADELPPIDRGPGAPAEAALRRPFRAGYSLGCAAEALFRSRCRRVAGQLP
jgi:Domain of unknown function (DUF1707)